MHIRAFFSIKLPLATKQLIANQLIIPLQSKLPYQYIRWTKMEDLHITLHFMEQIDVFDIESLIQNAKIELEKISSFYLTVEGLELFPGPDHPRVISLKVGPEKVLSHVAKQTSLAILNTHYPIETRTFRAHLTLAKSRELNAKNISFDKISLPDFDPIQITEIALYRSEPGKNGSNYTELAHFVLQV